MEGEPWPVGRSLHAACCLNYGQDHPQLLVHGGVGNDKKTLGILDVDTGKWTEVSTTHIAILCFVCNVCERNCPNF